MSEDQIKDGLEQAAAAPEDTTSQSESPDGDPRGRAEGQAQARIDDAKNAVADLAARAKEDEGAPFEPDALGALLVIQSRDPAHYQRVRADLKKAGVRMRDLDRELQGNRFRVITGGPKERAGPYFVSNHSIFRLTDTEPVPLCNFDARIVEEVIRDDGAERTALFSIEGTLKNGTPLLRAEVPANRYSSMNWVTENWGNGPVVFAGFGSKDHLRAAIQMLSGIVPRRTVYTHLGWRKIDGEWAYLHGGGAIGPNGPLTDIEVQVEDTRLTGYDLPEPPTDKALRPAIRASLSVAELGPPKVMDPLMAAVYRAPTGELAPLDLSLFVVGPTGVQKTEITAIAQTHFGREFHAKNLPGNWETTANALEKQAYLAKDAIYVVDDFSPTGTTSDVQRRHRDADRLFRGQGNRAGRGRMRPDGSARPTYHPQGIVVSSGEDIPRGQSVRARILIFELSRGDIDLVKLTEAQGWAAKGQYSLAMAGYIQWLARQFAELKVTMPKRLQELRTRARKQLFAHDRTPEIVASLALGCEMFLRFAHEANAITDKELAEREERSWNSLLEAAKAQAEYQANEEPASRFITLLSSAISSGQAHIAAAATNEEPRTPENWGWRKRSGPYPDWQPMGPLVGWLEGDGVFLDPDASFAAAQRLAQAQGGALPTTAQTLWKRLLERGMLASSDSARRRNLVRKMIGQRRRTVVHVFAHSLLGLRSGPSGPNGPIETDDDES